MNWCWQSSLPSGLEAERTMPKVSVSGEPPRICVSEISEERPEMKMDSVQVEWMVERLLETELGPVQE